MEINKNAQNALEKEDVIRYKTERYIRDVIERYLPAGSLYLIVDENLNFWDMKNLKPLSR